MGGGNTRDPLDSLQIVEKLWFPDADVVFCAGTKKFRVYRGILSAHSNVFKDMFALEQSGGEDQYTWMDRGKSLTVISLPDDPDDLRPFFLVMLGASYSLSNASRIATVSVLRLAHKYEVQSLIRQAIIRLDALYPLDREALLKSIRRKFKGPSTEEIEMRRLANLFDTVSIAITVGCRWIIPSLLYVLVSRYNISDIMEHPNFGNLQTASRVDIVRSRIQYTLERDNINAWVWTMPSEKCTSPRVCENISKAIQAVLMSDPGRATGFRRRFIMPDIDLKVGKTKISFCQECQITGLKQYTALEDLYWNQYPVACGFQTWYELGKMRSKWFKEKQ